MSKKKLIEEIAKLDISTRYSLIVEAKEIKRSIDKYKKIDAVAMIVTACIIIIHVIAKETIGFLFVSAALTLAYACHCGVKMNTYELENEAREVFSKYGITYYDYNKKFKKYFC